MNGQKETLWRCEFRIETLIEKAVHEPDGTDRLFYVLTSTPITAPSLALFQVSRPRRLQVLTIGLVA